MTQIVELQNALPKCDIIHDDFRKEAGEKDKSNLQENLLKEFDADGDGEIGEDEKPSEEQLKQFTKRRRDSPRLIKWIPNANPVLKRRLLSRTLCANWKRPVSARN